MAARVVDERSWRRAGQVSSAKAAGPWLGLWGDAGAVHMALLEQRQDRDRDRHTRCPRRPHFPRSARIMRPAIRLERAIRDLFGYEPIGSPDPRPWLDHGRWPVRASARQPSPIACGQPHPMHSCRPREKGCTRFRSVRCMPASSSRGISASRANGETVVRLEERLGYAHKGIESLMVGASLDRAARLAARISGDSTVAYSIAFARAVESRARRRGSAAGPSGCAR